MTDTLLHRDDLSLDQALQQSVGELGKGQRWRFCLVNVYTQDVNGFAFTACCAHSALSDKGH